MFTMRRATDAARRRRILGGLRPGFRSGFWSGLRAAALATAIGLTSAASAQFGEAAGFGEMMSPYFLRRDLILFESGLQLDDGQAMIVESLYWDYEDEHEAGKVRMLDRLSNMRQGLDELGRDEVLKLVFQPFEDRSNEWTDARDGFLDNIRAILNSEQLELWHEFRRELRREKELPRGRLSGESVNLHHIIHEMDVEEPVRAMAADRLMEYSVQLDQTLVLRETLMQESRLAMMHSIRDEEPAAALAIYERQLQARVAVRNTNDNYTLVISQALPEEYAGRFTTLAKERGYPRVYRPTAAQRLFAEARELEDISDEIYEAIIELETAFVTELTLINDTILRLLRDYEPEEHRYRASSFAQRMAGRRDPKPPDPSREEFRRRDDLGRRYVELLRALLTPEQFSSLRGAQRFIRRSTRGPAGADGSLVGQDAARKRLGSGPPGLGGNQKKRK